MNDKKYDIETLAFLAQESKDLLTEQIKSYTDTHNKAGVVVSISAIYIPVILFIISNIESPSWLDIFFSIPIILLIASIYLFLKILIPKKLHHGLNHEKLEEKLSKSHQEILLYGISANKKWINENKVIISPQQKNFKKGIYIVVIAGIVTFALLLFSYSINVYSNLESNKLDKNIPVKQIDSQHNNN